MLKREVDASIFYTPIQKAETHVEKKVDALPEVSLSALHPPNHHFHVCILLLIPFHGSHEVLAWFRTPHQP